MAKSSTSKRAGKPKRKKNFPLFAHDNGQWAKKIRGRLHYFGVWAAPKAAEKRWLDTKDDLLAGRTPRPKTDQLTLKELFDRFLTRKRGKVATGELDPRTIYDYTLILQRVADVFGKHRLVDDLTPDDFADLREELAETHGATRLQKDIIVVRMVFKWALSTKLLKEAMQFGDDFGVPSKRNRKRAKRVNGKKDFTADEVRRLLDAAEQPLRTMILLGINCGLGQADVANLESSHIDFNDGWLDYQRPKTEADRRCKLWPETLTALREALKLRPDPKNETDVACVFLTVQRQRFVRLTGTSRTDTVSPAFKRLRESVRIGGSFYGLRHTFATAAGRSRDQLAIKLCMGHEDPAMIANYQHRLSDEENRLQHVADVVHDWLWPRTSTDRTE